MVRKQANGLDVISFEIDDEVDEPMNSFVGYWNEASQSLVIDATYYDEAGIQDGAGTWVIDDASALQELLVIAGKGIGLLRAKEAPAATQATAASTSELIGTIQERLGAAATAAQSGVIKELGSPNITQVKTAIRPPAAAAWNATPVIARGKLRVRA